MKLTIISEYKGKNTNLEKYIKKLLFSDEVLLTGKYINIPANRNAKLNKVRFFPLNNKEFDLDFKNYLLKEAKGNWVFFINSDEIISKNLESEIIEKIKSNKFDGYFVKIITLTKNKIIHSKEFINMYQLRLGKKKMGIWESESNGAETWELMGNMGILKKPLIQIYDPNLKDLISEINEFTSFRARELFMENRKENLISIIFFPIGKFFIDYFLKRGFLLGTKGLIYAATMSFRTFLTRAKLWLLWKNES